MADHSLTLGSLLLTESVPDAEHDFVFNVIADRMTFGNADPVREVVVSLLADGDLVRTTRFGNREVSFAVEITGPDLASVQSGEVALRRELGKGNTLTWQAPDVLASPTVFVVIDSDMSPTFDDLDELRRKRTFVLNLTCAPFARSETAVTVEALETGTTTVSIDDGTSATGWTGTYEGAPAVVSTAWEAGSVGVAELDDVVTAPDTWTMTRTGAVDFTSTPYLLVEVRTLSSDAAPPLVVTAAADGSLVPLLSVRRIVGSAYYEAIFDLRDVGATSSLTFTHTSRAGEPWSGMFIRQMSRTDVSPGATARQQTRIIVPGGTERTPASLHVASANGTDLLSTTIVHTSPEDGSGYSPPLRRWRTSGNVETVDATTFSGKREPIHPDPFVSKVPTSALPEDGYLLAAFLRCTTSATVLIYWTVGTIPPGGTREGDVSGATPWTFTANVWQLVPLGIVSLPTVRTNSGEVQVDILRDAASGASVEIDDAWLFRTGDDCALSVVNVASPNLWLDSTDASTYPVPTVWVGASAATRTHPGDRLVAQGTHVLHPEGTAVFTATSNTDYPMTDATLYRRWHSNAAS